MVFVMFPFALVREIVLLVAIFKVKRQVSMRKGAVVLVFSAAMAEPMLP